MYPVTGSPYSEPQADERRIADMSRHVLRSPCALLVLLLPAGGSHLARGAPPKPDTGFRPILVVEAVYPGASAQVVADTVAVPIEQQVNGVEHLARMVSRCTEGRYTLLLGFGSAVDPNLTQVLVQNRVSLALPTLPAEVVNSGITVRKLSPGASLVIVLTSSNASLDAVYLSNYASLQIKDELARVAGVGAISLLGGEELELRVVLDPEKLAARSLTPNDVLQALRQQNVREKAGPVDQPAKALQLRLETAGRLVDAETLADVVLKASAGGALVRLKDVARVEVGHARSAGGASFDGRPAVALAVFVLPNARPRDVSAAVSTRMNRLKEAFPPGLDYSVALDLAPPGGAARAVPWCLLAEPVLPLAASAERSLDCRKRYAELLRQTEGVRHVLSLPENPFARFRGGPCVVAVASEEVKEVDWERTRQAVRDRLTREVRAATLRLRDLAEPAGVRPDGYPVDLALRGPDARTVREFGEALAARLDQTGKLTDVAAGARTAPQLDVEIDRKTAAELGVSLADITDALQLALGSAEVYEADPAGRTARVRMQLAAPFRAAATDLKRLQIRNDKGQMVPLSRVARIREVEAPASVDRVDLRPAASVSGNPAVGVSLAEARWLCETLAEQVRKELRLPAEYGLVWLQEVPAPKPIPGGVKPGPEPPPPEVTVARPLSREVADYQEFTGRIEAAQSVELRARVTGYLLKTLAQEGGAVKKGDLLFEIDPRPYQALLDQVQAEVGLAKARLKLTETTFARLQATNATKPELDEARAAVDEAKARVTVSQAALARHQLDLDFCRVTAPIDGVVGRNRYTPGNLVTQDQTLLTTIVSRDPMYAYFDVDERTFLSLRRAIRDGTIKAAKGAEVPVAVGLANEDGFPHEGKLDFVDNRVDPQTGALTVRAVVPDPEHLLRPGLFARVRLTVGAPRKVLLVPEEAIGSDLGQKFVYVVDEGNKVVSRVVTVGAIHDGLRVVATGLRPDDRVIVGGHTRARPGQTVKPVTGQP
jgi:multidrug efflux system membrane fusion protein